MKKVILVPALLGVMGIGGIMAVAGEDLIGSANDTKKLTVEQIEKKALETVNGKITELQFEKEGTKSFYEVEVTTKDAEYDLKFDAFSGELLKKEKDRLITVNQDPLDDTPTSNTTKTQVIQDDNMDDNEVKQTVKVQQPQPTTQVTEKQSTPVPVQKTVTSNRDDNTRYDDDRYEDDDHDDDDDNDRYEDDHDDDDDDRYEDDDDHDDD